MSADITNCTRPLQSKPFSGDTPPNLYFVPICARAIATMESRIVCAELLIATSGLTSNGFTSIVFVSCAIAGIADANAMEIATSATFTCANRFGDDGFMRSTGKSLGQFTP